MRCMLVCDCGRSIPFDPENRHSKCPDCHASYAVTITQIQASPESA